MGYPNRIPMWLPDGLEVVVVVVWEGKQGLEPVVVVLEVVVVVPVLVGVLTSSVVVVVVIKCKDYHSQVSEFEQVE